MPALSTVKMTAAQFLLLGEDPPGVRLELVDGEIQVSPSPTSEHSYTVAALTALLFNHLRQHGLGQVFADLDTVLGPHDVRRPDLLVFLGPRVALVQDVAQEPPDVAVEVISPSSERDDRGEKFRLYETHRVPHYWIVDPSRRTVEAYRLQAGRLVLAVGGRDQERVCLPPFPHLTVALGDLWRPRSISETPGTPTDGGA